LYFLNSLSGFKSANLLGTVSKNSITNLSIISSVIHLSSDPACIGFMQRPAVVPRHSYQNIEDTGVFTLNHIHSEIAAGSHYSSAKFRKDESEFEHCQLTEEYLDDFSAPFVKESYLKIAVKYMEEYKIKSSNTIMVVGSVEKVYLPHDVVNEDGMINLDKLNTVAISGLNNYHKARQFASFDYARPVSFPINQFKE